ncbi:Thiamine-triphosphatase [Dactylella cylindrospora]|nr:Thiamine-triphosphatase [Dactylella cylindrospora]
MSLLKHKFLFSHLHLPIFHKNLGPTPFRSLQFLGSRSYTDTYFDTPERRLHRFHAYVRNRNGIWELKQFHRGIRSSEPTVCQQFSGRRDVKTALRGLGINVPIRRSQVSGPNADLIFETFGLMPLMQFATARRLYRVDERFSVVLDTTDFGHSVGEVGFAARNEDEERSDGEIEEFMRRYEWFFGEGSGKGVKGKRGAYWQVFPEDDEGRLVE